ncbi:murein biosynthesis integral membrane protein MurJ [Micromonospora tulbaghiae]|uniref:Murein biosynthesis integral membrane protein MurJ n=1 Tax=Micromonospora tulbaghiae TaxID=479978 RepID=A0A386WGY2_9ACTN|nr:murein biosynthesis integral membrane protein MurJ [Micromonospora tulbaghiae]AYF26759.1 murein biosynthesis integral membrane protein MurJ [Micromonospora tulbaghiae]
MAVATLGSRIAGFVRLVVLASALGLGSRLLDSYNVANTLPNAVYELVVGGAMASVVVPLLARAALSEPDDGVVYAQRLLSLMVYGLGAVTVVAMVSVPWLVEVYTPGFTGEQRELAVVFSLFFLPQILFYGVSATAGAVLNIRGRFAAPTWAPLVNSLIVIAVAVVYLLIGGANSIESITPAHLLLLAVGTTAGVFAQMALVVWALARSGFALRPRLDPRGIGIRRIGRLGGWVLVSVVAAQVLLAAATRAASISGPGGISAYQNAFAVFQMPFAVIALSVMTAMLPRLSRYAAHLDHRQITEDLSRAIRLAVVALAPIAAAMLVLGPQIATVLFAYGRSSPSAITLLGAVVATFGVALVPFTGYMILQRGFYALQDTKTPALITAAVTVVGVAGCLAATWLLPRADIVVGIPLAYAAAYTTGLIAAAAILRRRLGRIDGNRLLRTHVRVAVAAGVAGSCAAATTSALTPQVGSGVNAALLMLSVAGVVGTATYVAVARLVRLTELQQLVATALAGIRTG